MTGDEAKGTLPGSPLDLTYGLESVPLLSQKTGGGAWGSRVEDAGIFTGSDPGLEMSTSEGRLRVSGGRVWGARSRHAERMGSGQTGRRMLKTLGRPLRGLTDVV